jgi:D-serine deaminase-like pyridoxal phosphate-dependent protein
LTGVTVVVDHAEQVRMYSQAGAKVDVLIDLDVGDHRTGIAPGEPALRLAETVMRSPGLRFRGLQAYSVRASHLSLSEGREEFNTRALQAALDTKQLLESQGIPVDVISGGSTGSCDADVTLPYVTELQAGSYALMDVAYKRIGVAGFGNAMTVLATVVSANHKDRVTVDAGFKAFSTDRPFGPEPCDLPDARYEWAGDEFGFVYGTAAKLGDRLRFLPPHCDPTVNLYERIHVCRGEEVVDTWRIK